MLRRAARFEACFDMVFSPGLCRASTIAGDESLVVASPFLGEDRRGEATLDGYIAPLTCHVNDTAIICGELSYFPASAGQSSAVSICETTPGQSPTDGCRNRRIAGYQGVVSPSQPQRQSTT